MGWTFSKGTLYFGMILDLQKNCKGSAEFPPCTPFTRSPALILCHHSSRLEAHPGSSPTTAAHVWFRFRISRDGRFLSRLAALQDATLCFLTRLPSPLGRQCLRLPMCCYGLDSLGGTLIMAF